MRLLHFRQDENHISPPSGSDVPSDHGSGGENPRPDAIEEDPLFIAVIIIGALIIGLLTIFMLAHYVKLRQRRAQGFKLVEQQANSPHSCSQKEEYAAKSGWQQEQVRGQERDKMIPKPLATRSSMIISPQVPETSHISYHSMASRGHRLGDPRVHQDETIGLKDDYKAWEAERRISTPGGVGLDRHPAMAPYLTR